MELQDLIEYARSTFGQDTYPETPRHPVPEWMPPIWDEAKYYGPNRVAVEIDPDDQIVIEGEPSESPVFSDEPKIETSGPDVLAFYVPYHFPRWPWGIYIRESGLVYLANMLKPDRRATIGARHLEV